MFAIIKFSSTLSILHTVSLNPFYYPTAPADYISFSRTITLDSVITNVHFTIPIIDDTVCDADERFDIILTSLSDCIVTRSPVQVQIVDNDGMLSMIIYKRAFLLYMLYVCFQLRRLAQASPVILSQRILGSWSFGLMLLVHLARNVNVNL